MQFAASIVWFVSGQYLLKRLIGFFYPFKYAKTHAQSGVEHGKELVAFVEAVVARDDDAIETARNQLAQVAGINATVDTAGVISNFQRMVRIADSTGIGLGNFETVTEDIRHSLGIESFRHHD